MSEHLNYDHQVKIFDPELARALTLIGAGSVGGQFADTVTRAGCTDVTVYDGDMVVSSNIPMSIYRKCDIMRPKVLALAEIIREATGVELKTRYEMYSGSPLKTNVIACVDDMEARMLIWKQVKKNPFVGMFIDTRIAVEYVEVFAVRPDDPKDIEYYEHFLYPSSKAFLPTCGNHGTKYISGKAANIACETLTSWWKGDKVKRHRSMLGLEEV